jgi:hypothetical protein
MQTSPAQIYADQRAHDAFWMTAAEAAEQNRLMSFAASDCELITELEEPTR